MMKHSDLSNENKLLKQENKKLKTKIKYLENYKADVSKTFKILDNELVLINDRIKNGSIPLIPPTQNNSSFQTSITPSVLNSLLSHNNSHEDNPPIRPENSSIFNNIFNYYL